MPELPEVETVRRRLAEHITGRTIVRATLHRRDVLVIPGDPAGGFSRQAETVRPKRARPSHLLQDSTLEEPRRHGKQLALVADDGRTLLVHLGMTGALLHAAAGARLAKTDHIHATLRLDDGSRVVFRDPRRFGGLWSLPTRDTLDARWSALGPDALSASGDELHERLARTRRHIKAALLDQTVIAGVGNIYADEALFLSEIHPCRPSQSVTPREATRIADAIRQVMTQALAAGGSTIRDYVGSDSSPGAFQTQHAVYGKSGSPCPRCGQALDRLLVAQRTTVACSNCQRA